MKEVTLSKMFHREKRCIKISFERDFELNNLTKKLSGSTWSKTHQSWYVAERPDLLEELFNYFKPYAHVNYEAFKFGNEMLPATPVVKKEEKQTLPSAEISIFGILSQNNIEVLERVKLWMHSKRYSSSTIHSYLECLTLFCKWMNGIAIQDISQKNIIDFNNQYILRKRLSATYQSHFISALKMVFNVCNFDNLVIEELVRPKKPKRLPNVLSKEEVKLILGCQINIKHRTMLSLIYSCGLRRGELLNLKLNDIDSKRGLVIIRQAKGRKDRVAPLSDKMLTLLRDYFMAYKPKMWLFEGQGGTGPYDERSLASVLKQALEKCKIDKPVTLHWLRHSYATHLLEGGTDLRYIQEILGHSRSTTTEIYTHVSTKSIQKVISPFDTL